jgi:hypothetical protein
MSNWMDLGLTEDEEKFVRIGAALYKAVYLDTIDNIFVIARSLKILHDRHHSTGIKGGFTDALVQYGFTARDGGPMNKAIRSHLGQLLEHEAEVRAWWETVPQPTKRDWLSAKAVWSHWTNSKKPPAVPRQPYVAATWQAKPEARPQQTEAVALTESVAEKLLPDCMCPLCEVHAPKSEDTSDNDLDSDIDHAIDVTVDFLQTLEPDWQQQFVDQYILLPLGLTSRRITRRDKLTWRRCNSPPSLDGCYDANVMEEVNSPHYFLCTSETDEKLYGVVLFLPTGLETLVDVDKEPLSLAEAKKFAEAHHAANRA